ncbi:MAG: RNA methyltransferase [Phycisphaerales bacterium]|nr:RNA methyltransferase [Phycisphaerales bacterium]
MNLVPIQDLSDPRLAPYANMRDAELAQRADPLDPAAHGGLFIAEGELVVQRLIESSFPTQSVLLTSTRLEAMRPALARLPASTPVFLADPPLLSRIVGFNMHRGVLAIGLRTPPAPLDPLLDLPGPLLVLEDLTNHDNLGGIFRNAAALGGPGCAVLLSPRCADPLYRKSLRVSMGHILSIPFARLADWPGDLARITAAGFDTLAMTLAPGSIDLETAATVNRHRRAAIVLGTEGVGLSPAALTACVRRVRIDMRPTPEGRIIDSLNVAMAAGIALYRLGKPEVRVPSEQSLF